MKVRDHGGVGFTGSRFWQGGAGPWHAGDLLWWSERDGWAHIYRFGPDGTLKNRLTEGPFAVGSVEGVDEKRGFVYFTAYGKEKGEDPYYGHLYRVGLDGRGLTLLQPGDFDHRSSLGESNRFAVGNYSRVNTIPAAALYDITTGRKLLDLEESDFSALKAAGYRFPEPFTVKAADGVTDLYGVMYRPFDFDSTKRYPLVATATCGTTAWRTRRPPPSNLPHGTTTSTWIA